MKYKLMHKNIPVMEIQLDDVTCSIVKTGTIYQAEHLPVGIQVSKGTVNRAALNEWWKGRAIPASRQGIRSILQELNVYTTESLLDKCLGLSLSDQYWICPLDEEVLWSEVNFFENIFSDDVGNILFGKKSSGEKINLCSPDNTSDGWLKKKWSILDGKRCLLKGGSGINRQEPYNEVFASILMKRLGIPHVPYSLTVQEEEPYSVCEDFITPQTELISAWYIMQTQKKENHVSVYQHYLNCCEKLDIKGIKEALDRMLVVDYLIVNEDRHQNNFGVVRNAETLEWIGAAPIYDSGTSLWFSTPTKLIHGNASKISSKPFKNSHEEQIKLVSSFEWLEEKKLHGIEEEFRELVKNSSFIEVDRCDAICRGIRTRTEMLSRIVADRRNKGYCYVESQANEVREDIAYYGK